MTTQRPSRLHVRCRGHRTRGAERRPATAVDAPRRAHACAVLATDPSPRTASAAPNAGSRAHSRARIQHRLEATPCCRGGHCHRNDDDAVRTVTLPRPSRSAPRRAASVRRNERRLGTRDAQRRGIRARPRRERRSRSRHLTARNRAHETAIPFLPNGRPNVTFGRRPGHRHRISPRRNPPRQVARPPSIHR